MQIILDHPGRLSASLQVTDGGRRLGIRDRTENAGLLALKKEERDHEPRNVGRFYKLGKAREWILL